MIDKIDKNNLVYETDNTNHAKARKCIVGNGTDATLSTDYDLLINRVIESSKNDTERVEQAKKLFFSGKLDSIENMRDAAANIGKYGV